MPTPTRSFGLAAMVALLAFLGESPVSRADDLAGTAWQIPLIDSQSMASLRRGFKRRLRGWVMRASGQSLPPKRFRLELDADWQKAPPERDLVILVHGYQSTPERHGSILGEVRKQGTPCGILRYPNDQSISESAKMLAAELRRLQRMQPRRRVTLLALSMGGLVARAVIEDPKLDPGNVHRLIMVAPPSHGSQLARFSVGGAADAYEFLFRSQESDLWKRTLATFEDGLGEASHDLRPGSDFLTNLNARERNPRVRYTIFLGSGGPLSDKALERIRRFVREQGDRNRVTRYLSKRALPILEDLDEVVAGRGDGAVALKRGRLEGVQDTVVFDFRHRQLMDGDGEGSKKLRQEILARLKR